MKYTVDHARKVLETVDAGLCHGKGRPVPGQMCVEAAVCFALGLPHSDEPPCVAPCVRSFKVRLNDAGWSTNKARASGLRALSVGQLGSTGVVDDKKFTGIIILETIRQILSKVAEGIDRDDLAEQCRNALDFPSAKVAASAVKEAAYARARRDAGARGDAGVGELAYTAAYYAYSAAAYYADDALRHAADAAAGYAYAVGGAAHAAYASVSPGDSILLISAEIGMQALRECGSPGVALWDELNH